MKPNYEIIVRPLITEKSMKLVDEEIDSMGFSIPINVVKEFIKNVKDF